MFLHELTRDQQRAFMVLARQIVAADERLALQEVERLDGLYREADLPAELAESPDVVGDLNYMFATPKARAIVLIELLLVGYADGRLDRRETDAVRRIADAFGTTEAEWAPVEAWAAHHDALVREARTLWGE